jgi:Protein of unknown function (DUF2442)
MKSITSEPATAQTILPMLPRIVRVEADPATWTILATFATGERRRYDVAPLLNRGVFQQIANPDAFLAVHPDEMGGVSWEAGPDLSRDTVYLAGECA